MKFSSVAALVSLLSAVTALPVADAAADPLFARCALTLALASPVNLQ
jgi:hypothetical protein